MKMTDKQIKDKLKHLNSVLDSNPIKPIKDKANRLKTFYLRLLDPLQREREYQHRKELAKALQSSVIFWRDNTTTININNKPTTI
jgi:hypothetical protein